MNGMQATLVGLSGVFAYLLYKSVTLLIRDIGDELMTKEYIRLGPSQVPPEYTIGVPDPMWEAEEMTPIPDETIQAMHQEWDKIKESTAISDLTLQAMNHEANKLRAQKAEQKSQSTELPKLDLDQVTRDESHSDSDLLSPRPQTKTQRKRQRGLSPPVGKSSKTW